MPKLNQTYLYAFALAALGCSQSVKPDISTETGNPPVIDSSKIALVVTRDEVHVRGEAGAIMPPEADVEVTIVRTRDATLDSVEDDGSFDVEVEATIDDVFEVRAVLGDLRSDVVIVDRGGAMVAGGTGGTSGMGGSGGTSGMGGSGGGTLGCDERTMLGRAALNEAIATADRSCEVDADCMGFYRSASCVSDCFGGFFSEEGLQSLRASVEEIDEGVCSLFESDGCSVSAPPCVPPSAGSCVDRQCVEDDGGGSCNACLSTMVMWHVVSAGVFPAEPSPEVHYLSGCGQYAREASSGGLRCETTVPQCSDAAGSASLEELLLLLENDTVQAAVDWGGWHGEPEETGGYAYEIVIGGKPIGFRTCSGVVGVECLQPGPLEMLIDVLKRLQSENTCEIAEADCSSPWDSGNCDALVGSWWHDPSTGACVGRIYGGCGGNANRYPSFEACQASCSPPVTLDDCGPGRQVREVCVQCGLGGGCMQTQQVCALECDSNDDCAGELDAYGATATCDVSDGVCQVGVTGCI